jgi:hypothetical protein
VELPNLGADFSEDRLFFVSVFKWAIGYCNNELSGHIYSLMAQIPFPG